MEKAIKLCLQDKIKRIPLQSSYPTLTQTIKEAFKLNLNQSLTLYYFDDENDQILLENQSDLIMALKFSEASGNVLKIFIELPQDKPQPEPQQQSQFDPELSLNSFASLTSLTQFTTEDCSAPDESQSLAIYQCPTCSRKFSTSRSCNAHSKVCLKIFQKKAEKFDLYERRLNGIASDNGIDIFTLLTMPSTPSETSTYQSRKCKICNRTFNVMVYDKHAIICRKKKKRTPFDTKKQRSCYPKLWYPKSSEKENQMKKEMIKKKLNWKKQSEVFRSIIQLAKEMLQ